MPDSALPPNLRGKLHWDWPWPFSKIPRGWTAWDWGKPRMVAGNQLRESADAPAPIGEPGTWQVSRFPDAPWWAKPFAWYVSATLKSGRHFRAGARWDDVDDYTQFPTFATRVYPPDGERDTSTK